MQKIISHIYLKQIVQLFDRGAKPANPCAPHSAQLRKDNFVLGAVGFWLATALTLAPLARADEAIDHLKRAQHNLEASSDQAQVTIKISESNGDSKQRQLFFRSQRTAGSYKAVVHIQSPADIKDTAMLFEMKGSQQNQWLYLPSSHQVRRIVSGQKATNILGSELNTDDLDGTVLRSSSVTLISKSAQAVKLQVTPKVKTVYSSALITLSLPEDLPTGIEYRRGSKAIKKVAFENYVKTSSGVYRAQKIVIKNLLNRRGTEVDFKNLKTNLKLHAEVFSQEALKAPAEE